MPWKKGTVTLNDGSVHDAELLIENQDEVWNVRIFKEGGIVEEIDANRFSSKLNKTPEQVYPFSYNLK